MFKWPKKLSKMIRIALADEIKCHRSPKYKVDMMTYYSDYGREVCHVCFAGGVFAQSMGMGDNADVLFSGKRKFQNVRHKLYTF